MAAPKLSKAAQHALFDIAERVLGLDTLERRGRDHLDFHDLHVWTLRRALEEAYLAAGWWIIIVGGDMGREAALSR